MSIRDWRLKYFPTFLQFYHAVKSPCSCKNELLTIFINVKCDNIIGSKGYIVDSLLWKSSHVVRGWGWLVQSLAGCRLFCHGENLSRWWRCWWWLGDDGEMTGGVELDAGDDIVESAGEKTGALDTGWHWRVTLVVRMTWWHGDIVWRAGGCWGTCTG